MGLLELALRGPVAAVKGFSLHRMTPEHGFEFRPMSTIGMLRESPLHADLKLGLSAPGDRFEVPVEGFVIDLVRADGELVEVQTGSFWPLRPKLERLLDRHRVRIVHPVAAERRVLRIDAEGVVLSQRRSPLKGKFLNVFEHLVSFPTLLSHPNFVLEVLLCREEHRRGPAPERGRRRKRDPGQRRLVEVLARLELRTPQDALGLLPVSDAETFSTASLARDLDCSQNLAQRFVYCLRALELVESAEKKGRTPLYRLCSA